GRAVHAAFTVALHHSAMLPPSTIASGCQFGSRPLVIFGIPGAANSNSPIVVALGAPVRSQSSTFVTCARPAAALNMADGYARVSGRPGGCVLADASVAQNAARALLVEREGESSALLVVVQGQERSLAIDGQLYPWPGWGLTGVEGLRERVRDAEPAELRG